jgi:outer membrane protein OmpA-like peptidoglycan-associated protein
MNNLIGVLFCLAFAAVAPCTGCIASRTSADDRGLDGTAIADLWGESTVNSSLDVLARSTIGGAAGSVIGMYMDNQADALRYRITNARIERNGEGILVTFRSDLLFAPGATHLNADVEGEMHQLAKTLMEYEDTEILIEGHTDSVGNGDLIRTLSERRAESVSSSMRVYGLQGTRFTAIGFGGARPLAGNETALGRQVNRRIEIVIVANSALKDAARTYNGIVRTYNASMQLSRLQAMLNPLML